MNKQAIRSQPKREMHKIIHKGTPIEYELTYSARRKTMQISIQPKDLRVRVIAPRTAKLPHITELVQKKASWILRKIGELEKYQPQTPSCEYVEGATHMYLGQAYNLKLLIGATPKLNLTQTLMEVTASDHEPVTIKAIIESWYRIQAKRFFAERMKALWSRFGQYNLTFPNLRVRKMKTRWGSCSTKGNVNLNLHLIQAPPDCIDYVIVHEFCHLVEMNHSPRFYRVMDKIMPDWRSKKEALKRAKVHI